MNTISSFFKTKTQFALGSSLILGACIMLSPLVANADMLTRQLEFGMSGADVSSLQNWLAKDATLYPQGLVTGYFGGLTKSAVSNFQSRNGIDVVGRVGPITLAALNREMDVNNISPSLNSLNVSTSRTTATINWNTNENAAAIVYYDTSPLSMTEGSPTTKVTIGGMSQLVHTDLRTSHSANLASLLPNTTYYYVVYVRDGEGNESISWPSTFTTTQ